MSAGGPQRPYSPRAPQPAPGLHSGADIGPDAGTDFVASFWSEHPAALAGQAVAPVIPAVAWRRTTERSDRSLLWLNDVDNRATVLRGLAFAFKSRGDSPAVNARSFAPTNSMEVDMDGIICVWLALLSAQWGINWFTSKDEELTGTLRALLRMRVLDTCAAALALASQAHCEALQVQPSASSAAALSTSTSTAPSTSTSTAPSTRTSTAPSTSTSAAPPTSTSAPSTRSAACASPPGCSHRQSASPQGQKDVTEPSGPAAVGASHDVRDPVAPISITGASLQEFMIAAPWLLLDVLSAVAWELISGGHCMNSLGDPVMLNRRQFVKDFAASLRHSNILELGARTLVLAMTGRDVSEAEVEANAGSQRSAAGAPSVDQQAEEALAEEAASPAANSAAAASLAAALPAANSAAATAAAEAAPLEGLVRAHDSKQRVHDSSPSELWMVEKGLNLFAATIIKLLQVKRYCRYHHLRGAAADLANALSGPCLRFAVLARGVATMVQSDGGPSYGLSYEQLPRMPTRAVPSDGQLNRVPGLDPYSGTDGSQKLTGSAGDGRLDQALGCLAHFLEASKLVDPPLSKRMCIPVLLRVCRAALDVCSAWRVKQQQQRDEEEAKRQQQQLLAQPQQSEHQQLPAEQQQTQHGREVRQSLRVGSLEAEAGGARCERGAGQEDGRCNTPAAHVGGEAGAPNDRAAVVRWLAILFSNDHGPSALESAVTALVKARSLLRDQHAGISRESVEESWRLTVETVGYVGTALDVLEYMEREAYTGLLRLPRVKLGSGALRPRPPPQMAAALAAGLLSCLERLVRRAAEWPNRRGTGVFERDLLIELVDDMYADDDDNYPLLKLLVYGEPQQAAAFVTSLGKAARRRCVSLVRACKVESQSHCRGLRELLAVRMPLLAHGLVSPPASGRAQDGEADDGDMLLVLPGNVNEAFDTLPGVELLLSQGPKMLAVAAAAAATAGPADADAGAGNGADGGDGGDGGGGAAAAAPPPQPYTPLQRLAAVVSLVAQQWLPDLAGPLAWAVKHMEAADMVLDMLELTELQYHLELTLEWVQLLALAPADEVVKATAEAAETEAASTAGPSSGGGSLDVAAANASWRRRALRQLGAVSLLGLELRMVADGEWRRRLQLPELEVADGPRLALLADCLCRVAALIPEDIRPRTAAEISTEPSESSHSAFDMAVTAIVDAYDGEIEELRQASGILHGFLRRFVVSNVPGGAALMARSMRRRGGRRAGNGSGGVDGDAQLSYWPPTLVRSLADYLRVLNLQPAAQAVQALAAELARPEAARRLGVVKVPEAPAEVAAASRALLPPEVVRQVLPLRTCSHPGCTNVAGDTEVGLRLLGCGRCGVVSYCSRACQTAHWRAGHKEECCKG